MQESTDLQIERVLAKLACDIIFDLAHTFEATCDVDADLVAVVLALVPSEVLDRNVLKRRVSSRRRVVERRGGVSYVKKGSTKRESKRVN